MQIVSRKPAVQILSIEDVEDSLAFEYYDEKYICNEEKLQQLPYPLYPITSEKIAIRVTDGDHGKAEYVDEGVSFLRVQNVKPGYLSEEGLVFISEQKQAKLRRSCVRPNDVLVTKTGATFGQAAVYNWSVESNCSCHVAIINISNKIEPEYLALFLNSQLGHLQMKRLTIKATRPEFKINEMAAIKVPLVSRDYQKEILKKFDSVTELINKVYIEIDCLAAVITKKLDLITDIYAEELNLDRLKSFQEPVVYTLPSLELSDRLDFNHNSLRYRSVKKTLQKSRNKYKLENLLSSRNSIKGGSTPDGANYLKEGIPFIRVQNITVKGVDLSDVVFISEELHEEMQRSQVRSGDVLITLTGTYGIVCIVQDDIFEANINQHIARLDFNPTFDKTYIVNFLNSAYGRRQADGLVTGGSRRALDYEAIRNLIVIYPDDLTVRERCIKSCIEVNQTVESLEKQKEQYKALAEQILTAAKANIFELLNDKKYQQILAMADEVLKTGITQEVAA